MTLSFTTNIVFFSFGKDFITVQPWQRHMGLPAHVKILFLCGKTYIIGESGPISPYYFSPGFFSRRAMGTELRAAMKISNQALEFIAAGGGHATLYLVPRPAADG